MARFARTIDMLTTLIGQGTYGITALELSRAVGLKRTPYFMELLRNLVDTGIVAHYSGNTRNGLPVRRFYVPEDRVSDAYDYILELVNAIENGGSVYNA